MRLALLITAFFVALLWALGLAHAHSFYDAACCSDRDCFQIPRSIVHITKHGYRVELGAKTLFVDEKDTRPSQDDDFHICMNAETLEPRCFYVPPLGS